MTQLLRSPRQAHSEYRALARFAPHRHIAAHHARELAGDGEAETGAAEALRGRGISLAELLEQLRLLLRRHPDAGIGDGELDEVAAIAYLACRKLDLARLGELAGIAQQIEQYLPQPHGVYGQCPEVLLGVDDEAVLVLLGKLSGGAEHLVDEAEEVSASAVHALQWLLRLFRAEARDVFDHHLGQADDGIEGRAQL